MGICLSVDSPLWVTMILLCPTVKGQKRKPDTNGRTSSQLDGKLS